MIYKVIFRRDDHNGPKVIEGKVKGVKRVDYSGSGGVQFIGDDGSVQAYFAPGTLIYLEKVDKLKTYWVDRLNQIQPGDSVYAEEVGDGKAGVFEVEGVDTQKRFVDLKPKMLKDGTYVTAIPFKDIVAVLPSYDSFQKGYEAEIVERR